MRLSYGWFATVYLFKDKKVIIISSDNLARPN